MQKNNTPAGISILLLFLLVAIPAYSQWNEVNSGTVSNLRSVFFINENIGWAAGYNLLLLTTDQGETWEIKELAGLHNSIFFIDELTGWVCSESGEIYKTTDGGITWDLKESGTSYPLTTIKFINDQTGFAAGFFQTILKSTDGGETWFQSVHDGYEHFLSSFIYSDDIFIVAGTNGNIFKTTNQGATWDSTNIGMPNGLYSILFVNPNTGFLFGCCGSYFRSTDSGLTWEDRGYITSGDIIHSSYFVNETAGWVVGELGWLLKTTDGGNTWFENGPGITEELRDVTFINENTGFIVGSNGIILKTTNGGGTSTNISLENEPVKSFSLNQNYPNPFNPTTKIKFTISDLRFASLKVYDLLGREVAILVNEEKPAGTYEVEFDASGLASNIYYYKLQAGDFSSVKKLILMK
jgi:photosystem II stability/assembly factor-like uncharacterized protein